MITHQDGTQVVSWRITWLLEVSYSELVVQASQGRSKLNNEKSTLLFDSRAKPSIIDATFSRNVGCVIDEIQKQECVGIGENSYVAKGRTRVEITLNG